MALTAANVVVAGTGAVYRAPLGTALPTSADDLINVLFLDHGYINQDGVAETIDRATTDIIAWQNGDLVRRVQNSHDVTYAFAALETNATTLETYYGNYDDGHVEIKGDEGIRGAWVLDFLDGDDRHVRIVIEDGQVTTNGGVTRNSQGAFEYPVTITCYPGSNGVKAHLYVDSTPVSST